MTPLTLAKPAGASPRLAGKTVLPRMPATANTNETRIALTAIHNRLALQCSRSTSRGSRGPTNAEVFRAASAEPALRGQGAALCAVRVFEGWVTVLHVGDCRVGRFREGVFTWLTEDHSLLAELRRTDAPHEQLAEVEMFHANVITRAVGVGESLSADVGYHPASPGDIYLLCSDGLSRQVGVARIAEILREQSPDLPAGCSALLDATEDAGGHDNATVILLRLSASSPLP